MKQTTLLTALLILALATVHAQTAQPQPTASANGYRLPTEAEWDYAARGGNGEVE